MSQAPTQIQALKIALIGNPNCGKTTIINALTGSQLRVGNWPGVTVERKSGFYDFGSSRVEVIDLPGTYALRSGGDGRSIDESIACQFIQHEKIDVLINVLDASNLERNLYLTTQLLDLQVPMIVVLNMVDVAQAKKLQLDATQLEGALACPVVSLDQRKSQIDQLKQAIATLPLQTRPTPMVFPAEIEALIDAVLPTVQARYPDQSARALILRGLECQDTDLAALLQPPIAALSQQLGDDLDLVLADSRYSFAHRVAQSVVTQPSEHHHLKTVWIDRLVLNRWLGIPIFLIVMYLMFLVSINVGGAFQDFFDIASDAIFVQGVGQGLTALGLPAWCVAIIADGAGKGVNTTLTFIPVIGMMFLCLSFLESCGYMVRAAFVMDRVMRALGLPGKSFVPMIVGFGCNVPAIMAARTLDSQRDRILTILMAPFMSCSARLAIFAVFTSAFFPSGGQNIVFALYVIGILMAVMTGWLLRKTILSGPSSPFIMEIPPYHWPTLRILARQTWMRLQSFIFKAGKLIVPICMLIGTLNAVTWHGLSTANEGASLLSALGQSLTPLFAPMGIHNDNWPATVGLLTGTLAKEVVVATLNTLYSQVGHLSLVNAGDTTWWQSLLTAWPTVLDNLKQLGDALVNPIAASVPDHGVSDGVYGVMADRFQGQAAAFAYLLFVLLYVPCASTIAVMAKELNKGWALFSVLWSFGLAYGSAVAFYQTATFSQHPMASLLWWFGIVAAFGLTLLLMKYSVGKRIGVVS